MKPILSAIFAMFFYAAAGVLMEEKLSKLNALTIIVMYSPLIFLLALAFRQTMYVQNSGFEFPTGTTFLLVLVLGTLYACADFSYVSAYTQGGDVRMVLTIASLSPVFASVIKIGLGQGLPNGWQIASYIVALAAIVIAAKGNALASK